MIRSHRLRVVISLVLAFSAIFAVCSFAYADGLGRGSYESSFLAGHSYDSKYASYDKAFVIDVSEHQGSIDWNKVYNDGFDYAIIRAGYRGYETGAMKTDARFASNYEAARRAGLKVGAYFFAQPVSLSDAVSEAEYFLSIVSGKTFDLPLFVDLEYISGTYGAEGRLYNAKMSKLGLTLVTNTYCAKLESAGYKAGVYVNYYMLTECMMPSSLSYPVWLARFASAANYSGEYMMWQFTDKAKVDGISGGCDMSVYYVKPGTQEEPSTEETSETVTEVTPGPDDGTTVPGPTDPPAPTDAPVTEPTTQGDFFTDSGLSDFFSLAAQFIKIIVDMFYWFIGLFTGR